MTGTISWDDNDGLVIDVDETSKVAVSNKVYTQKKSIYEAFSTSTQNLGENWGDVFNFPTEHLDGVDKNFDILGNDGNGKLVGPNRYGIYTYTITDGNM